MGDGGYPAVGKFSRLWNHYDAPAFVLTSAGPMLSRRTDLHNNATAMIAAEASAAPPQPSVVGGLDAVDTPPPPQKSAAFRCGFCAAQFAP